jgi:hypothetical protein
VVIGATAENITRWCDGVAVAAALGFRLRAAFLDWKDFDFDNISIAQAIRVAKADVSGDFDEVLRVRSVT